MILLGVCGERFLGDRLASWANLEADFNWRVPLVVLGAGVARRMGPANAGRSKILLSIRPAGQDGALLDGIVGAWGRWASELVLVVRSADAATEKLLARQPLACRLCLQPRPMGTTAALLDLADRLSDRFVVVLGDCLLDGRLEAPSGCFPGVAVWPAAGPAEVRANYGVRVAGSSVIGLEEKPIHCGDDQICGLGAYFLDAAFLDLLAHQPPDGQGRRELTDGLGLALSRGMGLKAVELIGRYVNVNTPDDLARARAWFGAP